MAEIKLKLKTPNVPRYIAIESPHGSERQDGFKELPSVAICDLTEEQLEGIAKDWRFALFEQAKIQRNNREYLKEN